MTKRSVIVLASLSPFALTHYSCEVPLRVPSLKFTGLIVLCFCCRPAGHLAMKYFAEFCGIFSGHIVIIVTGP